MLIRGAGHGLDATVKSGCVEVEGVVVIHFGIPFFFASVSRNERVALVPFVGRRSKRELLPHMHIYIYIYVLLDVGKHTFFGVQSANWVMQIRGSIMVSISARHAEDPGSIPG